MLFPCKVISLSFQSYHIYVVTVYFLPLYFIVFILYVFFMMICDTFCLFMCSVIKLVNKVNTKNQFGNRPEAAVRHRKWRATVPTDSPGRRHGRSRYVTNTTAPARAAL